jgi:nitrogen fixation/metabolism regulation signal transduction histidine kinase
VNASDGHEDRADKRDRSRFLSGSCLGPIAASLVLLVLLIETGAANARQVRSFNTEIEAALWQDARLLDGQSSANAIEAMEGSQRQEIVIEVGSGEDGLVAIAVIDTGPGIALRIAERPFQPFVTSKGQGMWVGLALCRAIVEAHGGHLWAAPNPEGGNLPLHGSGEGLTSDRN